MCCLKYEEAAYEDLVKKAPKVDAFVETPSGKGSVTSVNLLRGNAKVRLEDGVDTTLKTFTFDELDVLGGKGRRQEYIAARAEGKLEEAGFSPSLPPEPKQPFDSLSSSAPAEKPRQTHSNRRDSHSGGRQNSEHRKPQNQPRAERAAKEGERPAKLNSPQASEGSPKKHYSKRRRGGGGRGHGGGGNSGGGNNSGGGKPQ